MSRWLTKAKDALRRRRRGPVPFEVTSSAGNVIEGLREPTHQVVTCPVTGERLFVLPLDVYPSPVDRRPTGGKGRSKQTTSTRRTGRGSARTTGKAVDQPPRPKGETWQAARRKLAAGWQRTRERARSLRQWFTPLRATVAAMGVVVLLTLAIVWRSRSLERAEIVLRTATNDAWTALAERDFEKANEAFDDVVHALDVLGRDDAHLRRAAREVEIGRDLTEFPFVDVVDDVDRYDERHRGHWVVLDASAVRGVDLNGTDVVRIEYPLLVDDAPLDLLVDARAFDGLDVPQETDGASRRIVFAAKLGELERPEDAFGSWTLRLEEPVVWVHERTLPVVGFVSTPELRVVLIDQAQALGIDPADAVPESSDEEPPPELAP